MRSSRLRPANFYTSMRRRCTQSTPYRMRQPIRCRSPSACQANTRSQRYATYSHSSGFSLSVSSIGSCIKRATAQIIGDLRAGMHTSEQQEQTTPVDSPIAGGAGCIERPDPHGATSAGYSGPADRRVGIRSACARECVYIRESPQRNTKANLQFVLFKSMTYSFCEDAQDRSFHPSDFNHSYRLPGLGKLPL